MAYIGASPPATALTASDIADGIISEAKMANDAISLAELKAGTDGELISWDASGNPVAIGAGTSGHFLKSQGAGSQPVFAAAGGGKIGQVVSTSVTDTTTTTSTSLADVAGMTVNITPAASSSKVLIFVSTHMVNKNATYSSHINLVRDSTLIALGDAASNRHRGTIAFFQGALHDRWIWSHNSVYLDSPSTTSQTTYKLQWKTESSGQLHLNRTYADEDETYEHRLHSSITVMEVLA